MNYLKNILSLVLPVVLLSACAAGGEGKMKEAPLVKVAEVRQLNLSDTLAYPGKIVSEGDINVAFRVSGPIKKVLVQEGQYVKKGEVLALMDPRDYEVQLSATKAEYEQVRSEAERVIELHKRNSVANKDYDKAVAGLHRIEAKLRAHQNALNDTKLKAPFSGYVQKIFFDDGEMVKAGLPVLSLVSTSVLQVEAYISAADYLKKDCFDTYSCRTGLYPEVSFPLSPAGITRKANLNQLYKMVFTLDKSDSVSLSPGMSVDVNIVCSRTTGSNMYVVPVSSLFSSEDNSFVWLYDENSKAIRKKEVKVSKIRDNGTALVSGELTDGCRVVSAGVNTLKEGQTVRLLKKVSKTNVGGLL
ncbi:MAG: efflux RND transporter periplasmic adaptor subunit [Chlorobi bacterium]|nr:efflux RND transporter periplasmic adaptor subunit [Chlorobiota bacterium]